VFVFLSAGALHRVGPGRLYVQLARELATMGFNSLRVDLSGIGDSPAQPGATNRESVAADCKEILDVLDSRLGHRPLVLAGLCAGADNAVRLAGTVERVMGMVLLDPYCFADAGFQGRAAIRKYIDIGRYMAWLERRLSSLRQPRRGARNKEEPLDYIAIRNLPTLDEFRSAFRSIGKRGGRALSVFTQYALPYYNRAGQLEAVLGIDGYRRFSTELFWPQTEHTYPLELHRRRLIDGVKNWARAFVQPIRAPAIAQRTGDIEPRELAGDAYCVARGAPEELIRT